MEALDDVVPDLNNIQSGVYVLVRLLLVVLVLVVSVTLVITHGVRGIAILVALAVIATVPQTRVWRTGEFYLVRLTGSRQRALALVMFALIAIALTVNVYQLVH
jgi:hypothetical protein